MKNDDDFKSNLVKLFEHFNNNPNHLVNFLLDNNALNKPFCEKVNRCVIPEIKDTFNDICELEDFFSNILDNKKKKNTEEYIKEINLKLNNLIDNQLFEDAAKLRDYMIKNKIQRI